MRDGLLTESTCAVPREVHMLTLLLRIHRAALVAKLGFWLSVATILLAMSYHYLPQLLRFENADLPVGAFSLPGNPVRAGRLQR